MQNTGWNGKVVIVGHFEITQFFIVIPSFIDRIAWRLSYLQNGNLYAEADKGGTWGLNLMSFKEGNL